MALPLPLLLLVLAAPPAAARSHGVWVDPTEFTPAQIAGVVVGCVASVLFVVGCIVLCIYIRRRDRQRMHTEARRRSLQTMLFIHHAKESAVASAAASAAGSSRGSASGSASGSDSGSINMSQVQLHAAGARPGACTPPNGSLTSLVAEIGKPRPARPLSGASWTSVALGEERMLYN